MSLWNTAKALGLKCQVVPVMPSPCGGFYEDVPTDLFETKFRAFNEPSSGTFELEQCGPQWGHEMPVAKMTWLNGQSDAPAQSSKDDPKTKERAKTFEEVQMAVSLQVSQRHDTTPHN